jgi:hypothetical protein
MVCLSQSKPDTLIIHGNEYGEPISEDAVRFRLLYSGDLKAHNELRPKGPHKHEIRSKLSPQLQRLWETKTGLRRYASIKGAHAKGLRGETYPEGSLYCEDNRLDGIQFLADLNKKLTTRFIPLVVPEFCLRCRIDVLLLRPEDTPQHILQSGDLDNRVKTLFDALRIPQDGQLIDDGGTHFVLLKDDSLITEVGIVGDNLLMLPGQPKVGDSDAFAVIDVQLETTETEGQARWIF